MFSYIYNSFGTNFIIIMVDGKVLLTCDFVQVQQIELSQNDKTFKTLFQHLICYHKHIENHEHVEKTKNYTYNEKDEIDLLGVNCDYSFHVD